MFCLLILSKHFPGQILRLDYTVFEFVDMVPFFLLIVLVLFFTRP
uniref:Uncharacterized protein n=1 Tax=Arundo donax TaxID=35708 RepID=A0A0A9C6B9_ARUDO